MSPIQKAVQDCTFKIPAEILRQVFIDKRFNTINYPVSVESQIIAKVVKPRVLVDCNLVGGIQIELSLRSAKKTYDDGSHQVYVIPKTATQGRSIISVMSLGFNENEATSTYTTSSSMIRESLNIIDAANGYETNSTSSVTLIDENTIHVEAESILSNNAVLRCVVSNDPDMQNLNPRTIPAFTKLVEFAVKSYIYNQSIISIDTARLHGGMSLGIYRDIVEGYADAEELYTEYRDTKMKKILFCDDKESYHRHIKLTSSGV